MCEDCLESMTARALKHPLPVSETVANISSTAPGMVLGRKGSMQVRLARDPDDVAAAQAVRYRVFYEELSARPDSATERSRRDSDAFDDICDHLLVIESVERPDDPDAVYTYDGEVVGTYRLLRQEVAERTAGFYTQDEFDIAALIDRKPEARFLELGRSCVLKAYRTKPVVELLWQGIWNYVRLHKLDVMLGCASMIGTDLDTLALPLSFLHHRFRAPEEWRVRAQPEQYVELNRLAADEIDDREAMRALPPLIKGYLRLGAHIGDGAVVDDQFNTTDVLIILPVSSINARYFSHFGSPDDKPLSQ